MRGAENVVGTRGEQKDGFIAGDRAVKWIENQSVFGCEEMVTTFLVSMFHLFPVVGALCDLSLHAHPLSPEWAKSRLAFLTVPGPPHFHTSDGLAISRRLVRRHESLG